MDNQNNKKYIFAELVDINQIRKVLEDFYKLTRFGSAIADPDGNILVGVGWKSICIDFHRVCPETLKKCQESDEHIKEHLTEGSAVEYKCKNGLWDMAYPIFIEKQHVATIFTGQYLYDDEEVDRDFFVKQAEKYGFNKKDYLEALDKIEHFPRDFVKNVMQFFVDTSHMFASQGLANCKLKEEILASEEDKERLRISEEKYKKVLKTAIDGFYIVDSSGRFKEVNNAYCTMVGYTQEEILSMSISDIEALEKPEEVEKHIKKIKEQGFDVFHTKHRKKSGEKIDISARTSFLDQEKGTIAIFVEDITKRKRIEDENEKHTRELEVFYEAAVGQERRIIKLKEEIEKLKSELENR